jgi:GTP cyclohydrolase I
VKNKMSDVRDHLVAMLEALGEDSDPEQTARTVERAKATALVADKYIAAVKVEIDAREKLQRHDLPPALTSAPALEAIEGRRSA